MHPAGEANRGVALSREGADGAVNDQPEPCQTSGDAGTSSITRNATHVSALIVCLVPVGVRHDLSHIGSGSYVPVPDPAPAPWRHWLPHVCPTTRREVSRTR